MGADLLLIAVPYGDGSFMKKSFKAMRKVVKDFKFGDEELNDFACCDGNDEYYADDDEGTRIEKLKAKMHEAIDEMEDMRGRRDTNDWMMGGQGFILTGGMSWGESPTAAYDVMVRFSYLPRSVLEAGGFVETTVDERFLEKHGNMPERLHRDIQKYLERQKLLEAV